MAYSKVPRTYFELEINHINDLKLWDRFGKSLCEPTPQLFNAATGGCFTIEKNAGWKVRYDASAMKSFGMIIAISKSGDWLSEFQLFTNANGIISTKMNQNVSIRNESLLNEMKIAIVFGLIPTDNSWSLSSMKIDQFFDNEINEPNHYHRCAECLVFSTDGRGHGPPCPPLRTISPRREHILSDTMTNVFKIRFESEVMIHVLNSDMREFVQVGPGDSFFNEMVRGIFF